MSFIAYVGAAAGPCVSGRKVFSWAGRGQLSGHLPQRHLAGIIALPFGTRQIRERI
jgi:hypothetical protein